MEYYKNKKELVEAINSNMDTTINYVARMLAYRAINDVNIPEEDLGKVVLKDNYEYLQPQEVAAWRTAYEIKKGEYQAKVNTKEGKIRVYFEAKAELTEDYTPSLYGGVKVGENKENPNIGKETTMLQGVYSKEKFDIEIENDKYIAETKSRKYGGDYIEYSINFENEEIKQILEKRKLNMILNYAEAAYNDMDYRLTGKGKRIIQSKMEDLDKPSYEIIEEELNKPENIEKFKKEFERNVIIQIRNIKPSELNNEIESYIEKIKDWKDQKLELEERFALEDLKRKEIEKKIENLKENRDERVYNATFKEIDYLSYNVAYNNYLENKLELTEENFDKFLNKAVSELNTLQKKNDNKIKRKI